jgi:PilZ domain-containing protein
MQLAVKLTISFLVTIPTAISGVKWISLLRPMSTAEPVRIERRCGHRFSQFQVPVLLRAADGRTGNAFTLDLSSHGALLWTDFPASENQLIEMTLVLPCEVTLTEEMHVRCSARVLRLDFQRQREKPAVAVRIENYEYLPRQLAMPHPVLNHAVRT